MGDVNDRENNKKTEIWYVIIGSFSCISFCWR